MRHAWTLVLLLGAGGCGDEEEPKSLAEAGKKADKIEDAPGGAEGGSPAGEEDEEDDLPPDLGPRRPRPPLTRDDFADNTRDPFQNFLGGQTAALQPDRPKRERAVKMAEYSFEDLKLVAIVTSSRGVAPRALFVASDGKSQSIEQGEYFSRAEVLLAAVNRDYVEIEVVDEDLADALNLARGERRALYLRNE